jgi:hypothetical protein
MKKSTFIRSVSVKHNNFYDYSKINLDSFKLSTYLQIICPVHGTYTQLARTHYKGSGCNKCAQNKRVEPIIVSQEEYINLCKDIHKCKYDYSLINQNQHVSRKDKIKILCPIHGVFEQNLGHHLRGSGCQSCSNNKKITLEYFLKKSREVHGLKYNYSLVDFKKSKSSIKIICPIHDIFNQRVNHHLAGSGCSKCTMTNGERIIENFLTTYNIEFEYQKIFKDCKDKRTLPFDFYLPNLRICIEYDGIQHFENNNYFKTDLLNRKRKDEIKDNYCKNNNIKLIRLSKKKDIKNKLKELI